MPDNYLKHKRDNNDRSGYTSVEDSSGNPIFSYLTRRANRALVRFRGTITFARGIVGGMLQFKKKSDTTKYPSGTNLGLINMNQSFSFRNSTSEVANLDNSGNLQIDGNLTVSGNRKFTETGSTDGASQGDVIYMGGTTSMTAGKIYYFNSSGGWTVANADAEADASGLLAVALGASSDNDGMLLRGMVTLYTIDGTNDEGKLVYLRAADGEATITAPSTSTHCGRVVGYLLDATNDSVWFNPDSTWVEIA